MPVTPLQSNKESERNNNRNSKRRKSKFSFLTSQFFPSTINSLDDESNIAIIALPANPKGLKPAAETKQHYTKEERQTSFNFIDESIGDPFIFYQILSYLPVSSHLSTSLDMGKIFSFDYCVQYTRRELYKKMEHSLLNCMLVHPRWYELIDKDVFFKIMVNSQFSKYFQFYYNERVCNNTSTNDLDRFWRNTLRDIVENFRWSPFISREKEYFYNYWDSKDHGVLSFLSDCFQDDLITESSSGMDSYSSSSDKSVFEMIRDGSEKVYICRGGRIQGNGKVIQAPIEKIPRLKCTYQLFRTDKPILCDMIVDFQVCNLPVRKSDETCIPPSHEMLNIHQDNFILLGIIDSDLLNSRGDYLSCPEQTSLVTDVMTESSSAKFNYLGEYNLQSRFRGRQREINLNLGYASNGFISYSTIIDGKFTERWRIGDIISFEIRGINSFLEKTATSRKKEYASVTIIRNGRFVCHVEDFMILNRIVSIRENSPNPFPKLYYFACNFYYGSVASSLNQTPQSNSLLPTLPNQNSNNYVPAIRINRVTYL